MSPTTQPRRLRRALTLAVASVVVAATVGITGGGAVAAPVDPATAPSGNVVGWGSDAYGQSTIPAEAMSDVVQVAASYYNSAALKSDGSVVTWGYPGFGVNDVPAGLSGVTAVEVGNEYALALKNDGTVVGWGSDFYGILPAAAGLTGVVAITAGYDVAAALKNDGTVVALGSISESRIDESVTGLTAISASGIVALGLKADGTVTSLSTNSNAENTVPDGLSGVTAISAGYNHALALKSDGTVVAWGVDADGQTDVPPLGTVTAIAAGAFSSAALQADGTVVAWGNNDYGQVRGAAGLTNVTAISGGIFHYVAIQIQPFTATATPTILGTARVGSVLNARPARVDWAPRPKTFDYQWLRDGVAIDGATAAKYRLVAADAGAAISVRVTANLAGYASASVDTAATTQVETRPFTTVTTPTIKGTPAVGRVLTGKTTVWTPKITSRTFAWTRDDVPIEGATGTKYTLTEADKGTSIRFVVTGNRTDYVTAVVRSGGLTIQ
jgi:hypothetical protein